jgi:aspartate ammonia-lyase
VTWRFQKRILGSAALRQFCITGIEANEPLPRVRSRTSIAAATALAPALGYSVAAHLAKRALGTGQPVVDLAVEDGLMDRETAERLIGL